MSRIADVVQFLGIVAQVEAMPTLSSNGGGCRGYPLSVWYGQDCPDYVVDYNEDGSADRVARVGTGRIWHYPPPMVAS